MAEIDKTEQVFCRGGAKKKRVASFMQFSSVPSLRRIPPTFSAFLGFSSQQKIAVYANPEVIYTSISNINHNKKTAHTK